MKNSKNKRIRNNQTQQENQNINQWKMKTVRK